MPLQIYNPPSPVSRIIHGRIDTTSPGTILNGTGFTIQRNGMGDVTITFVAPFSRAPVVLAICELFVGAPFIAALNGAPTISTTRVLCGTGAGPQDLIFEFAAIGL